MSKAQEIAFPGLFSTSPVFTKMHPTQIIGNRMTKAMNKNSINFRITILIIFLYSFKSPLFFFEDQSKPGLVTVDLG